MTCFSTTVLILLSIGVSISFFFGTTFFFLFLFTNFFTYQPTFLLFELWIFCYLPSRFWVFLFRVLFGILRVLVALNMLKHMTDHGPYASEIKTNWKNTYYRIAFSVSNKISLVLATRILSNNLERNH